MIPRRKFGQLDVEVSVVGFGAASLSGEAGGYSFGAMDDAQATDLITASLDAGINLFDTAPIYGFGESERRLGLGLRGRRDDVFIVSKCGIDYDDQKRAKIDNDPKTTTRMLSDSLRRLQTEFIDLYMVHWPDPETDIRYTMEALVRAQDEGKIKYIGLSNPAVPDLELAREIGVVDAVQLEASFLQHGGLASLRAQVDIDQYGVMSWGTLAKGILAGTVNRSRSFEASDVRAHAPWWINTDHEPSYLLMEQIEPILKDHDCSGLGLALGYLLNEGCVHSMLCGMKNRSQLTKIIDALSALPSPELINHLIELRSRLLTGNET